MVNTRAVLERLYEDRCTISVAAPVLDPDTNITSMQWEDVVTDEPCRLSFEAVKSPETAEGAAKVSQTVQLFLSSDTDVLPGSRISVERPGGFIRQYRLSGEPAVYGSHQEIPLELEEERA
jgi:hypothetical protein